MSFFPLPRTFLDDLSPRPARVVELGCGDGRFTAVLRERGLRPLGLDRRSRRQGSAADVVADAVRLPLPDGGVDLLVAANLLRQVWPPGPSAAVPPGWLRCLRPGGLLYIFEDEPGGRPAAARNYRDLQRFLSLLAPGRRRPLLARARFARRLGAGAAGWTLGRARNRWPVDAGRVAAWLDTLGGGPEGEAARLAAAIRDRGLDYGTYWWARYRAEGTTAG